MIWAGGGGGGADVSTRQYNGPFTAATWSPARGGGGGQGFDNINGSYGGEYTNGSSEPPHPVADGNEYFGDQYSNGNSGNYGGEWGQPGADGNGTDGGAAGIAIKSNGFAVSVISGDNSLSIRGLRT